jgi:hypothetical protein
MMVGGQLHAPTALPPGKRPGAYCIGGWVGPRTGLDGCGKSRPQRNTIPGPCSPQRVAIPATLSRPTTAKSWPIFEPNVFGPHCHNLLLYDSFYIFSSTHACLPRSLLPSGFSISSLIRGAANLPRFDHHGQKGKMRSSQYIIFFTLS